MTTSTIIRKDQDQEPYDPFQEPKIIHFDAENVLAIEADRVRTFYYNLRPAFYLRHGHSVPGFSARPLPIWDGGVDALGKTHQPVWPKIVRFAARNAIDPGRLVEAAYDIAKGSHPPTPNALMHERTLAAARPDLAQEQRLACLGLASQHHHFFVYKTSFTTRYGDLMDLEQIMMHLLMSEAHRLLGECLRLADGEALDSTRRAHLERVREWHERIDFRELRRRINEVLKQESFR
jgi:hypothetical protein